MSSIITHILRRTPMLYRSGVIVSSYSRIHQKQSNILSRAALGAVNLQTTEADGNSGTSNTKLMEYLTLDASNLKRVNYKVLHSVVNSAVKEYVPPSEGAFLLQCCTMLPDTSTEDKSRLIDSIWNDGIIKSGDPNKQQIIALLRAYKVIGRSIDDFDSFLTQHNCQGDRELYEEYLHLMCANGTDSDGIAKVVTDIKTRGYPLTENSFNALILGHSNNKNVESCEKILETMTASNLSPSAETYMYLVRACIENGDITKATRLLSDQGGTFSQEQIFSIVRTAAVTNNVDLIKQAMKLLPVDSLLNKKVAPGLRNICVELINLDQVEMAYSIIDNLPHIKFTDGESTDSFGIFIIYEMFRRNDDWSEVMDIAQRLVDSHRNERALHAFCGMMLRANSPHSIDCLKYLSVKEPLQPHYFWPIIYQQYNTDGEAGILNALNEMKKLKVSIDEETIAQILPKLTITMKDVSKGVKMLCDKGVPINLLLTSVVCHLLQELRIEEAVDVMKSHKTKVDGDKLFWPLIRTLRKFDSSSQIGAFVELAHTIETRCQKRDLVGQILTQAIPRNGKTIDGSVLVSLLKEFQASGIKISSTTCDQLLLNIQRNLPSEFYNKSTALLKKLVDKEIQIEPEQSDIFKHPRNMTLSELECHLVELQSKNMNCRAVLRQLLQHLVRERKYDRAVEIHQLCKENGVDFSPGMLASTLDLMIHTKNVSEAEATLNQLKRMHPTFSIDSFKIIDLASLMIENGRIEQARKILQDRAKSKLVAGAHCHKNIWTLLTNVAIVSAKNQSSVNQCDEFLQFLTELGYCTFHNQLAGPIIKEYLLKNEIGNAMAEFDKIYSKYKKTPMQFELMTTLIELSNKTDGSGAIPPADAKEMLNKVVRTVMSVHGTRNANVSLIVAVAKAGTEGQLRKILMDPKLDFNAEYLLKQCEYLGTVNAVPTLFKLAKCSRGLGRLHSAFKEEDLYNLLLNEYVKENNYSDALALFERMTEDEDIRVTKDFTRKVADLFEKNNLEFPSVLQMHLRRT